MKWAMLANVKDIDAGTAREAGNGTATNVSEHRL
jgi:hypothetical protein